MGSRVDQQVLWGLAFGGHKSWGPGSQAPGDSCKRKRVLAMLKHPSMCIMGTDCITGEVAHAEKVAHRGEALNCRELR